MKKLGQWINPGRREASASGQPPVLLAMDFDNTIAMGNVDNEIQHFAIMGQAELRPLCRDRHWAEYMQHVFNYIHHKTSRGEKEMRERIERIDLVPGMGELLRTAGSLSHVELVIISDSNTLFIQWFLERHGLADTVNHIFSNPAKFNEQGGMELGMYHTGSKCELSTANLCKGAVLKEYIKNRKKEGVKFKRVVYVGDGKYDMCPAMKLRKRDVLCPRKAYNLQQLLDDTSINSGLLKAVSAAIAPWENGAEIIPHLVLDPFAMANDDLSTTQKEGTSGDEAEDEGKGPSGRSRSSKRTSRDAAAINPGKNPSSSTHADSLATTGCNIGLSECGREGAEPWCLDQDLPFARGGNSALLVGEQF